MAWPTRSAVSQPANSGYGWRDPPRTKLGLPLRSIAAAGRLAVAYRSLTVRLSKLTSLHFCVAPLGHLGHPQLACGPSTVKYSWDMGFPAARLLDMHLCPMVTPGVPPIPHVGGPILPTCSVTVLTGMLP